MTKIHIDKIKNITEDLLQKVGIENELEVNENQDVIFINIITPDSALLIGSRGETLSSFEHIIKILLQKEALKEGNFQKFNLDVCNYRKKQSDKIEENAHFVAEKVIKYNRSEVLRPMNAYERRIVHMALKNFEQIVTESVGEDPERRIIIKLKHENL